jgi:hypothetical protein
MTRLQKLRVRVSKDCGGRGIRDEDLACLAGLTRLRELFLAPQEFSDEGLKHLSGLIFLERLGVGGSGVTDAGLAHLSNLKKLNYLSINGAITNQGLRRLEGLNTLTHLSITSNSACTQAAIEHLRRQLPNLQNLSVVPRSTHGGGRLTDRRNGKEGV